MFQLTRRDQNACQEFLRDLVRTPSFSGQEEAVAERIAAEMRRIGFPQVERDRVGNIIGRTGEREGPRLLFNGHMDTVGVGNPAAWQYDPFGAVVEDGVLHGRGAVDMKGALAAMIYGAKLLLDQGLPSRGELIVAAVVQEEPCEGRAMQVLMEEENIWPNYVVLGEPTDLNLALGHRGRLELRVVTEGRACHASAPELGVNALYAAAKIIFDIELLAGQLAEDPVLGKGSIAVTGLEVAAGSRNVVPDRCELIVDRRLTLGETREQALAQIQQIIEREAVKASVHVAEYEMTSYTGYVARGQEYYPPWLMAADAPLVRLVGKAVERALGSRPALKVWRFSTDGAYTRGVAGVPTIGFGPGEERFAHTAEEQVRLTDVWRAASGYAQIAQDVLSRG